MMPINPVQYPYKCIIYTSDRDWSFVAAAIQQEANGPIHTEQTPAAWLFTTERSSYSPFNFMYNRKSLSIDVNSFFFSHSHFIKPILSYQVPDTVSPSQPLTTLSDTDAGAPSVVHGMLFKPLSRRKSRVAFGAFLHHVWKCAPADRIFQFFSCSSKPGTIFIIKDG